MSECFKHFKKISVLKNILPRICLGHFMKCFVSQLHCHIHSLSLWDPPSSSFAVCQQLWFSFTCGASHIPVSHWTCFKLHPPTCPVSLLWIAFCCFPSLIQPKDVKNKTKTKHTPTLPVIFSFIFMRFGVRLLWLFAFFSLSSWVFAFIPSIYISQQYVYYQRNPLLHRR